MFDKLNKILQQYKNLKAQIETIDIVKEHITRLNGNTIDASTLSMS